jgi:NAD+ synthase
MQPGSPETAQAPFSANVLRIDSREASETIAGILREQVFRQLKRKGAIVAMSGGIDSSVVAALCVRALGAERVLGLFMPETDSSPDSLRLGRLVADSLGIQTVIEEIGAILDAVGCYRRRDAAISEIVPGYRAGFRSKVVLPDILHEDRFNISSIVVESPSGERTRTRMTAGSYRAIIAATNFKQRVRKMLEYYHADRLNYAVAGTPNRLEYDQGFFVKQGDGAADVKPIAHLYKTQVYELAEYLDLPEEIRRRTPTTDTFSLPQTQEEFYFALPYHQMDLCLFGHNHGVPAAELATAIGLTEAQVERVYRDIEQKRRTTRYLQMHPLLVEDVPEVTG